MKKPPNIPTGLNQRVKLRGRLATGEVVSWYPDHRVGLCCTVAWEWECYLADPPIKGMAWFLIMPEELEVM